LNTTDTVKHTSLMHHGVSHRGKNVIDYIPQV
jgi:hypothetical protein